jgi:hypothetical protein
MQVGSRLRDETASPESAVQCGAAAPSGHGCVLADMQASRCNAMGGICARDIETRHA